MALMFSAQVTANAVTFNMPPAGEVEIVGDLSTAITVSVSINATPLGASYWALNTSILQSGNIDGPFSEPQGCVGTTCGSLAGFYVCGGMIGCGISLIPGTVISRTGLPMTFGVSDTSRFLTINTSVTTDGLIDLQLTADLPDALQLLVINDPIPEGIAQTPLPTPFPLFATGVGAMALLVRLKKRKAKTGRS